MAWLSSPTVVFLATMASSLALAAADLIVVGGEKPAGLVFVRNSHSVLFRQKRDWVWNKIHLEEERPTSAAYKIGKLESNKKADGVQYEIFGEGANSIFTVDPEGDLYVTRTLDREEKSSYRLSAKMFDRHKRLIERSGEFFVYVTDINDNSPEFTQTFNGSVSERSSLGTKVVQVQATDADDPTTANADLRYSLTADGELSEFKINNETGLITCNTNTLDRETISEYVVVVKAQDMRGMKSGSSATTSVTITIRDINDNVAYFAQRVYNLQVREDHNINDNIVTLELRDNDELPNKQPIFTLPHALSNTFKVRVDRDKNGVLLLEQALDYEKTTSYTFTVHVREPIKDLSAVDNSMDTAALTTTINIQVLDVDEPPVFSKSTYTFSVEEGALVDVGYVKAEDPDKAKNRIIYSISDRGCPLGVHSESGKLSTLMPLDRELKDTHDCQVKAQEEPNGLESFVTVKILVQDVNDNKPELAVDDIYVCETDAPDTVIGLLRATDKDDQPAFFTFALENENSNFSIRDLGNNTAEVLVKQGPFSLDDVNDYAMEVRVSDGGKPIQTSVTKLAIKTCSCGVGRTPTKCKASAQRTSLGVPALLAILFCIVVLLVIVILFGLKRYYRKESVLNVKGNKEIHEQLVTYDEEGGGEMDTHGFDMSILSSACQDGSLVRRPNQHPHPSLYAMVQKAHHPSAPKGDMAAMIERKKVDADLDQEGHPYDTLHIYGYEGPGSLAGSLCSIESSSTASNLDYDFLNDWGPRFKTLAELYGVDEPDCNGEYC